MTQELPDHVRLVRERQGHISGVIGHVRVAEPLCQEVARRLHVVHGDGAVERVATDVVRATGGLATAGLDQVLGNGGAAGEVERGLTLLVATVRVAVVRLEEKAHHVQVARLAGEVERRLALLAPA